MRRLGCIFIERGGEHARLGREKGCVEGIRDEFEEIYSPLLGNSYKELGR